MNVSFRTYKIVFVAIFLLVIHSGINAQCDIPNGNFDEVYYWPELLVETNSTFEINSDSLDVDDIPEIPVDFRPDFVTTIGWWLSLFLIFAPVLTSAELQVEFEANPTPELQASIDSLDAVIESFGDFWIDYPFYLFKEQRGEGNVAGIKLWSLPAADYFITPFECTEEPAFLRGEFKNVGSETDSLLVSVIFGKRNASFGGQFFGALAASLDSTTVDQFEEFSQFGIAGESYLTTQTNDYEGFEIPLNYDAIPAEWDSVTIRLIATTDTNFVNLYSNNTATFWLDNFEFSDVSFDEEKLENIEELDVNEIIDLLANSDGISEFKLYTTTGIEVMHRKGSSDALIGELRKLPSGIYLLHLNLENNKRHSAVFGKL